MIGRDVTIKSEIDIRGSTLKVSVGIEGFLMRIVFFSNADQYEQESEAETLKLKNVSFGSKVERTRLLLKKYHKDLYVEYKETLNAIDKFVTFRNRMSHCPMIWEDRNVNVFTVWDVKDGKDGFEELNPISYEVTEAFVIIATALQNIPTLTKLSTRVELRLQELHPRLYARLIQGLNVPESK